MTSSSHTVLSGESGNDPPRPCVPEAMARRVMNWVLILFTMALVGCDHATKAVAQAALERRPPLSIVPGVLDLRYAENRDMAFSLLRGIQSPAKVAFLFACSMI